MLSLTVNGSPFVCRGTKATIADLIAELALEGKRVAVERNGEIVPRSRHAQTRALDRRPHRSRRRRRWRLSPS